MRISNKRLAGNAAIALFCAFVFGVLFHVPLFGMSSLFTALIFLVWLAIRFYANLLRAQRGRAYLEATPLYSEKPTPQRSGKHRTTSRRKRL